MALFEVAARRFQTAVKSPVWAAAALGTFFLLLGSVFVGYAGVQTDEALFAGPLCRSWRFFSLSVGGYSVPVMNMQYNGALKTWLYAPILLHDGYPNAALLRMPAIFMGAVTIVMFWGLLRRAHSYLAAWAGCILLVTDTSFLLMTTYDWGPVVLQHLLLVSAMYFGVRWYQTNATLSLATSGLCCGLALWDKAEFVWILAGVSVGLLVWSSQIRSRLTRRNAAAAVGAVFLGALPLIFYNLTGNPLFGTLRSNPHLGSDLTIPDFGRKIQVFRSTLDGSGLFGYLVNEEWAPRPKAPRSRLERVSFEIRRIGGEHRRNDLVIAFYAALALFPLLWRTPARRTLSFALIAMVVGWLFMAGTGGGGSAHHAVLLWPLPQLFIGIAFAEAAFRIPFGRRILVAVILFIGLSGVMVINQYLYQFIRDGASDIWSDGIYNLARSLRQSGASQIVLPDWGLTDCLCLLTHDKPKTHIVNNSFLADTNSPSQKEDELGTLSDKQAIWVEHTLGHEIVPGVNNRILSAAGRAGFKPQGLQTFFDSNGRAIFQTLRFARIR